MSEINVDALASLTKEQMALLVNATDGCLFIRVDQSPEAMVKMTAIKPAIFYERPDSRSDDGTWYRLTGWGVTLRNSLNAATAPVATSGPIKPGNWKSQPIEAVATLSR